MFFAFKILEVLGVAGIREGATGATAATGVAVFAVANLPDNQPHHSGEDDDCDDRVLYNFLFHWKCLKVILI